MSSIDNARLPCNLATDSWEIKDFETKKLFFKKETNTIFYQEIIGSGQTQVSNLSLKDRLVQFSRHFSSTDTNTNASIETVKKVFLTAQDLFAEIKNKSPEEQIPELRTLYENLEHYVEYVQSKAETVRGRKQENLKKELEKQSLLRTDIRHQIEDIEQQQEERISKEKVAMQESFFQKKKELQGKLEQLDQSLEDLSINIDSRIETLEKIGVELDEHKNQLTEKYHDLVPADSYKKIKEKLSFTIIQEKYLQGCLRHLREVKVTKDTFSKGKLVKFLEFVKELISGKNQEKASQSMLVKKIDKIIESQQLKSKNYAEITKVCKDIEQELKNLEERRDNAFTALMEELEDVLPTEKKSKVKTLTREELVDTFLITLGLDQIENLESAKKEQKQKEKNLLYMLFAVLVPSQECLKSITTTTKRQEERLVLNLSDEKLQANFSDLVVQILGISYTCPEAILTVVGNELKIDCNKAEGSIVCINCNFTLDASEEGRKEIQNIIKYIPFVKIIFPWTIHRIAIKQKEGKYTLCTTLTEQGKKHEFERPIEEFFPYLPHPDQIKSNWRIVTE